MDRRKIILIDPENEDSEKLQTALKHSGFEIFLFRNGEEAYASCIKEQPSLVLSELFIPGLNGVQLFQRLRTNYSTQHIPFVVITHEKEREERIKSMQLGIDDYIQKPFYVEEVVARVEMLLTETEVTEETRRNLEHGFSGSLSEMNLVDLIQTLEVGDKSAVLRLSRNGQEGVVYVEHGEVRDVSMDNMEPNRALASMLTWINGKFMVKIQTVSRERMIKLSNKEIFEYGTKKIHEWRQLANQLPQLNKVFQWTKSGEYPLSEEEQTVADLFKDGSSIQKAVETSRMDDLQFLQIVKRLIDRELLIEIKINEQSSHTNSDHMHSSIQQFSTQDSDNIYSRVSSFFTKERRDSTSKEVERRKYQRRLNGERRVKERRKNGSIRRANKVYLSKDELLLIHQKLT